MKDFITSRWGLATIGAIIFIIGLTYFMTKAKSIESNLEVGSAKSTSTQYAGATIETNKGTFEITFIPSKAPLTVRNFIKLSEQKFYNDTKFHRVIKNFMIQGGDPLSKGDNTGLYGTGGPGYDFKDEINDEKIVEGVVAMANRGPDTNGSQFFVVTAKATSWLDGKHTVFAKVTKGMDVVRAIEATPTKGDIPIVPVIVNNIILRY
ncbi:MAG TPA: peptidylprolyl isomerase [Candidatus Paceibacterota bacterium]